MNEIEARGKIKYRIANEMRKAGENKEEYEDLEIALLSMKELREYRELGTVEEFKALKEKNEPKKVIRHGYAFLCPTCYRSTLDGIGLKSDWCPKCGQKLDWWMKGGATDERICRKTD